MKVHIASAWAGLFQQLTIFPPLRTIYSGVWSINGLEPVQVINRPGDSRPLGQQHG